MLKKGPWVFTIEMQTKNCGQVMSLGPHGYVVQSLKRTLG